jgi:hypothetical protein
MLQWGISALDQHPLPVDQRLGDLPAGLFEHSADRRPGDTHALGGVRLIQSFNVDQAQRLELVEMDGDRLELIDRGARRFENRHAGEVLDASRFERPCQINFLKAAAW